MTSMEKKLTENRLTEVKAALSAKYRTVDLGGEKFFVATDGAFFRVGVFPGAMALVIEYADTEQEARQNALEDGDRFYLDETTLDEMLRLMIAEIEKVLDRSPSVRLRLSEFFAIWAAIRSTSRSESVELRICA